MIERLRSQLEFTEETPKGSFTDALYFESEAEYFATPKEAIKAAQQERIDEWIALASLPPKELTKEELQKAIVDIDIQKVELDVQKVEYLAKIAEIDKK